MSQDITDDSSTFGSGNGLLPDGTKPLLQPISTKFYVQTHFL